VARCAGTAGSTRSSLGWVPRFRGWRRGSLYRGDGEEFLVHGEKRGGDREAARDGFIPYMATFLVLPYWGGDREAAEVALTTLSAPP
jgi:hypothetical protein